MRPGLDAPGAAPGGGLALMSGASLATLIVTGVVALLLSLRRRRGGLLDPYAVRVAILATAFPCEPCRGDDRPRFLVGRLNIPEAHALFRPTPLRVITMHDQRSSEEWNWSPDADASTPRPASESLVSGRPDGAVADADAGLPAGGSGGAAAADLEPASTPEPAGVRAAAAREQDWVGGDRPGLRREIPAVAGGVLSAGVVASDG